jgi:hypothetical protein
MDLFGFSAPKSAPPARRSAPVPGRIAATAPVQEVPPPVVALPPQRTALPAPTTRDSQDIQDVTDGAAITVASILEGFTLQGPGNVYAGASLRQVIRWIVRGLDADGWLQPAPEPGAPSRFLVALHPPMTCPLEVYQLLTQMEAAISAGQIIAGPGQDHTVLTTWAIHARRTLHQHRAVAQARGEPHA